MSAVSSYRNTFAEDLALWQELGVSRVGLTLAKIEAAGLDTAVSAIEASSLDVTNVIAFGPRLDDTATWKAHGERIRRGLEAASAMGASCAVLTTGPAGALPWEAAAERFGDFVSHVHGAAAMPLLLEHTNSLRADVGFVHTLRDAVDLVRSIGLGVLCELNACWSERAVHQTIRDSTDVIGLVQVSDYVIGTKDTPNRAVPGDGDIPLDQLFRTLIDAGYDGVFDIELIGPLIEDEGYESAIRRSVTAVDALLRAAGA